MLWLSSFHGRRGGPSKDQKRRNKLNGQFNDQMVEWSTKRACQIRDFVELLVFHPINISHIEFAWGQIPVRSRSNYSRLAPVRQAELSTRVTQPERCEAQSKNAPPSSTREASIKCVIKLIQNQFAIVQRDVELRSDYRNIVVTRRANAQQTAIPCHCARSNLQV
jgi:hypothetical protein